MHIGELRPESRAAARDGVARRSRLARANLSLKQNFAESVFAETESLGDLSPEWIPNEFFAAFGTEIETQFLIHLVADFVAGRIVHAFENFLDFFEVVAVFIVAVFSGGIEGGVDFDFDNVTKIVVWIEFTLAQIA
jgi:hypothetical protein